jgi:hypothetical protein
MNGVAQATDSAIPVGPRSRFMGDRTAAACGSRCESPVRKWCEYVVTNRRSTTRSIAK